MRHLMANYDAAVRPVQNSSLPLTVIFGVSLHHIIDVVSKNIYSSCSYGSVLCLNKHPNSKIMFVRRYERVILYKHVQCDNEKFDDNKFSKRSNRYGYIDTS